MSRTVIVQAELTFRLDATEPEWALVERGLNDMHFNVAGYNVHHGSYAIRLLKARLSPKGSQNHADT